jgi:enoyl-CoA hydratase
VSDGAGLVRERHEQVVVLRIDRPRARNALTAALMGELGAALVEAERDPATRAVVLTGTGDRAFCAGMDLTSYTGAPSNDEGDADGRAGYTRFIRGELRVPVVGAANGAAVAGGFELLLACDVVVATESARFGLTEVKRGLIPGGNGIFLVRRVPFAVAMEMSLTGDSVDARRAYELGLVNSVVPADGLLPAALALATRIVANAPLAVAAAQELARLAADDPTRAWERLDHLRPLVFASDDAKEGAQAFLEKREPTWRGR